MLVDQFRFQCHRFMSSGESTASTLLTMPNQSLMAWSRSRACKLAVADVDHLVFEIENLVHVELNGHIRNTFVPNVPVDVQEESVA